MCPSFLSPCVSAIRQGLLDAGHPLQSTRSRGIGLDVQALAEHLPELAHEATLIAAVEVAKQGLDGLGSLLSVIEGDAARRRQYWIHQMINVQEPDSREKVVDDVVLDDAVEKVTANEAKLPVDRGEGALNEGPAARLVVRDLEVSVVQVGDGHCNLLVNHISKLKISIRSYSPSQW